VYVKGAVDIGAFFDTFKLETLPTFPPYTSRLNAGALVPIPTLPLLITMRVTPEVSKAN
jgi:hypothetical protein